MSETRSPSRYNSRGMDDAMLYDATFAQDISHKMRVPKRIKATGDVGDEDVIVGAGMPWEYQDKFDMNVPDRILLAGQDQHIGTKAPPREITLENSVLPVDPGMVRVNTPPRVITLDHHHFPSAVENTHSNPSYGSWQGSPQTMNGFGGRYYQSSGRQNNNKMPASVEENRIDFSTPNRNNKDATKYTLNQNDTKRHLREMTPLCPDNATNSSIAGEGLSAADEIVHLRRQMARLNRRLMAVEVESQRRQQREKFVVAAGLAYIILKVLSWLNRN